MKDRITRIMVSEGLTAAQFADKIGVLRSSISHILSGRNNPSLDFIQKIMQRFPQYNAEWIVAGSGEMMKKAVQKALFEEELPPENPKISTEEPVAFTAEDKEADSISDLEDTRKDTSLKPKDTVGEPGYEVKKEYIPVNIDPIQVEQVLIFYTDGTFKSYRPKV